MSLPQNLSATPSSPSETLSHQAQVKIGPHTLATPVELAPMAGVTNASFRRLCREFAESALPEQLRPATSGQIHYDGGLLAPAGLFVTEMVTTRALVERNPKTLQMVRTDPTERLRSIQLYGVDPNVTAQAVEILVRENLADHIDLNFGCPVPKVTRKGGGSALPWKRDLFKSLVNAAVQAAKAASESRDFEVPVTIKMRIGIDDDHITYLDSAREAEDAGVSAIALHARTAQQHYSGSAQWDYIGTLKQAVSVPVLGNGDIWVGDDAVNMLAATGADGVVVGRGCQGRPWLFADLVHALHGSSERTHPDLAAVLEVIRRHADLLSDEIGPGRAIRDLRKHIGWYLKGYSVGGEARNTLMRVSTREELEQRLSALDASAPYPGDAAERPRGRAGHAKRPHLPDGWLDSPYLTEAQARQLHLAESDVSGG